MVVRMRIRTVRMIRRTISRYNNNHEKTETQPFLQLQLETMNFGTTQLQGQFSKLGALLRSPI